MTKQNELKPHKIESTGKTVFLRRVSVATLMIDLWRENPKPLPPLQKVNIAGQDLYERNYAHPDYPAILESWERDIETKTMMILLSGYVHIELTDDDKNDVAEFRERMDGLLSLNGNDKQIWLRHIAIQNDQDLRDLMLEFRKSGQPTEEGVAAAADGFPDQTR